MVKKTTRAASKTYAQPSQGVMDFMLPQTSWKPVEPVDWPDFRKGAEFIGVDTETHDPNLMTDGPGFIRGDAKVVGISLANDIGETIYLPIAHAPGGNYDPAQVRRYVNDMLSTNTPKVFANALYDIEALWHTKIEVSGEWCDIQTAEPLIDEERADGYSLNSLALSYLGEGKIEGDLSEAASAYGVDSKAGLHLLHPKFVAEYAEADALKPIEIWQKQMKLIKADGLEGVLELERKLQPVLWEMRRHGHRLDLERLASLDEMYSSRLKEAYEKMYAITRRDVKYTSGAQVGALLEKLGYSNLPYTKTGVSLTNEWLIEHKSDELCQLLFTLRDYNKMHNDFIKKLLRMRVGDRIHPSWIAMASEEGGTKTGRLACRDPGLQQIPARSEHVRIREAFVAEKGKKFVSLDYRAVEPRLAVEFASRIRVDKDGHWDKNGTPLPGASDMLQTYLDDPSTDFHNAVQAMIKNETGELLPRKDVKDVGLGVLYSLGEKNMAIKMGITTDQCRRIREAYFKGAPFIKGLIKVVEELAGQVGYTRTLSGRRKRFNLWQPSDSDMKKRWGWNFTFNTMEEALRECGKGIERAFLYRAPNAKIQGSSADITKSAMVELYYEHGIFPLSSVHDELNFSTDEGVIPTIRNCMETIAMRKYNCRMPFATATAIEDNWGACK